jgi:hypothetical protein
MNVKKAIDKEVALMYIPYTMQVIIYRNRKPDLGTVTERISRDGRLGERERSPTAGVLPMWPLRRRIAQALHLAN